MKKLLILSGKGGTGKTTIASAFVRLADVRAVADCDVDAPNLHLVSDLNAEPVITDFMGSKKAFVDADCCVGCNKCTEFCRFHAIENGVVDEFSCEGCGVCELVCPVHAVSMVDDVAGEQRLYAGDRVFSTAKLKMGRGNSGKLVSAVKQSLFDHSDAELAIIDGSPGIGCPVIASMSGVDLVLIVAEPSMSGVSDLQRLVQTANRIRVRVAVCINKFDVSMEMSDLIAAYCAENKIPFVGMVPYDQSALKAMNAGKSLVDLDSKASKAIREMFDKTLVLLDEVE